jgi:hypothetical protein
LDAAAEEDVAAFEGRGRHWGFGVDFGKCWKSGTTVRMVVAPGWWYPDLGM